MGLQMLSCVIVPTYILREIDDGESTGCSELARDRFIRAIRQSE